MRGFGKINKIKNIYICCCAAVYMSCLAKDKNVITKQNTRLKTKGARNIFGGIFCCAASGTINQKTAGFRLGHAKS